MSPYSLYTLYLFSYLLGSIPFGLLIVKAMGGGDIREQGSGNIGATNVLRSGHKKLAIATLLSDALKGVLPVLLAQYLDVGISAICITAGAAILGHIFPLWLSFKGGKGVATAFGCYLAIDPLVGVLCLLTWLIVAKFMKISSLSALVALFMAPLYEGIFHSVNQEQSYPIMIFMIIIYLIILWTHRDNIKRILNGEEKFTTKK